MAARVRALLACLVLAATPVAAQAGASAESEMNTGLYAEILERHVVSVGGETRIDYAQIAADPEWERLVRSLEHARPDALETPAERLAFWLNAHNVLAIDLVARHYPVASIRDIGTFLSPVWKQPARRIGGRAYSLTDIRDERLRPIGDPRIFAAMTCAAVGCPRLGAEPFRAGVIHAQLDSAATLWLRDRCHGVRIDRNAEVVWANELFAWYADDFDGGVVAFAARYLEPSDAAWLLEHAARATVRHLEHDWRLDGTATPPAGC